MWGSGNNLNAKRPVFISLGLVFSSVQRVCKRVSKPL